MAGGPGVTSELYGAVELLRADNGGAYPFGNSLVIRGNDSALLVDPSLAIEPDHLPVVDAVLVSHAHEDHMVELTAFAVPVHVHLNDLAAARSVDELLAGSGLPPEPATAFRAVLEDKFRIVGRADATAFHDGQVFDLGGRTVTVVHLPGHTRGHSGFLVEPDGFFYVGDIDLTSFGPLYGDVGSDLDQFEQSLTLCEQMDARWFGTFHQKGVLTGVGDFRRMLRDYRAVIGRRDDELLDLLDEPRTLSDVVEHRLVYRPHVDEPYVRTVEARTAEQHLARLVRTGAATETEPGLFRRSTRC